MYLCCLLVALLSSLVPRPSPAPVFEGLQYSASDLNLSIPNDCSDDGTTGNQALGTWFITLCCEVPVVMGTAETVVQYMASFFQEQYTASDQKLEPGKPWERGYCCHRGVD